MARAKAKSHQGTTPVSSDVRNKTEWLNYRLTPQDAVVVLGDCDDTAALCNRLAGIFISGADFSIRYVPERKNYSAFAITLPRANDGVRVGISAFGGDVWQAIAALLFKCDLYSSDPEQLTPGGTGLGIG